MSELSVSRNLSASPTEVWDLLAAFDKLAQWAPAIEHSSYLTEQRHGAGTTRRVQMKRTTLIETVVEWEPEMTLAYRIEGLPPIVPPIVNKWSLRPDGTGTEVTLETIIGTSNRLRMAILSRPMSKTGHMLVDGLSAYLEESTP